MKPMLAGKATTESIEKLLAETSLFASPKLDGVRGLVVDGQLLSRSLKPIRNAYVQDLFGRPELNGYDGELIFGSPTADDVYRQTNSAVMRSSGAPDVKFYVFDSFDNPPEAYEYRLQALDYELEGVEYVDDTIVTTMDELDAYEKECLTEGYEGVMLRRPDAPYKFGRSTANQGYLLKLKRFSDSEAEVIGFEELMHNDNEAQTNELGRTFRSTAKQGLVGAGVLGALLVRDIHTGVEFKIGTGFDANQRATIWWIQDAVLGKIAKYKFFDIGVKDKPRHPVFLDWRDADDM